MKKKKIRISTVLLLVLLFVLFCVVAWAGWKLYRYYADYSKDRDLYSDLRDEVIKSEEKENEAEETTKSGIVLPGQAQEKPQQAEVVAVGPGGVVDGKEVKMEVAVGDKVIYSKYSGTEVKMDGTEYIIVKQNDILAIVK